MLPWIAALAALVVSLPVAALPSDDGCLDLLPPLPELSVIDENGVFLLVTECQATLPTGRVIEATEVHWYAAVLAATSAVAAWFATAGLVRAVPVRRAVAWVAGVAAILLLASAIFFIGA